MNYSFDIKGFKSFQLQSIFDGGGDLTSLSLDICHAEKT